MKVAKRSSLAVSFILLLLAFLVLPTAVKESAGDVSDDATVRLTSDVTESVDIVKDGKSDYSIVFSASDSIFADSDLASALVMRLYEDFGVTINYSSDATSEKELEILLGSTNRALSEKLDAEIAKLAAKDPYVWIIAEEGGKLAFGANCAEAFERGAEEFMALIGESDFSIPAGMHYVRTITEEELEEEREQARLDYIEELNKMNAVFTEEQFGKNEYKPMIGENGYYKTNPKNEPWVYPTADSHPRYLVTEGKIEKMREILADPTYSTLSKNFWEFANAGPDEHFYGVFPEVAGKEYRYSAKILAIIDAKAMAYLITGDETYALEAVICIKNAILNLNFTKEIHGDVYHGPSHLMVSVAAVYDWCYDAISESDKWQLIYAVATKLAPGLESGMQYPPYGMHAVSGHGTGPQFLRDWMTVSTVFYDEAPDWWSFVGGRYFQEYLPVANIAYQNGWVSQGTAIYGCLKIAAQAWAAYLIKTSTGENFFVDSAVETSYYMLSHMMPNGRYFQTGDGARNSYGSEITFTDYFIVAALFNDPVIYSMARDFSFDHDKFFYTQDPGYDSILTMTPAFQLALTSMVDYNGESSRDGVDPIQYFGYPATQMTAREAWDDPDAATVMMRIGNLTMANHDIYDHGTFQIYYKGLLACSSGVYNGYAMPAHYYYHQATVAQNGLLIFNPSLSDAEPIYDESKPVTQRLQNASTYYYSGSQDRRNEAGTLEYWLGGGYDMATTLGAAWDYKEDGTPEFAYVAGDLTLAYNQITVDYVARRMFTLFTDDPDYPAVFFTFDQLTSDKENYEKTWLLHVIKEPTVDEANNKATVINGEGKMFVYSLFGDGKLESVGGKGKAYWINGYYDEDGTWVEGKNCTDEYTTSDNYENIWGRLQIRTSGALSSELLTMMAITDKDNERELERENIVSETALGAVIDDSVIVFSRSHDLNYKTLEFTHEGKGLYKYYITGLDEGTWNVTVDGMKVATCYADAGEAVVTFVAPMGAVSIVPDTDVIGANGGKIQYNAGGAILPEDAPYVYRNETATPLPTEVVRDDDVFLGWYTTPTYDEGTEIKEIPAGTTGLVKVYAKFFCTFVNEDFTTTEIDITAGRVDLDGVAYNGLSKEKSSFKTKTDENGVRYLEWIEGTADPLICQTSSVENLATMTNQEHAASMTFEFSLHEGYKPIESHFRLIAKKNIGGADIASQVVVFINISNQGVVTAANGEVLDVLSEDHITSVKVVLDFENTVFRYYDENYEVITEVPMNIPGATEAKNGEEFRKCLTEYIWYWYGGSSVNNAALRVYKLRAVEGDEFAGKLVEQTEGIKYHTGGAKLPKDAPKDFASVGATPLPEDITLDGCIFGGWYTTPDFKDGTRVYAVPEGTTGLYEVYARWHRVFVNEDYSADIDIDNAPTDINGVSYGGNYHPGVSFKTETDPSGGRYLVWNVGTKDPIISVKNPLSNISAMADTTVSYTIGYSKHGDAPVPEIGLGIIAQKTVTGAQVRTDLNFGKIDSTGIYISDNAGNFVKIGSVEKDFVTTVRIAIDFADGTVIAYDGEGKEITSLGFAVPAASGAATALEWKQCFNNYILYSRHGGAASDGSAIRIHGIRIAEGNEFADKSSAPTGSDIYYRNNGGTLPEGSPTEYDPVNGTELPIPTKSGFAFGGWYTTSTFDAGTRVTHVGAGENSPVTVYARWVKTFTDNDFENTSFDAKESTAMLYDGDLGFRVSSKGSMLKTETDESGNKYVKVTVGGSDSLMLLQNDFYNLTNMASDSISIQMDILPIDGVDIMDTAIKIATSGGANGQLAIARINPANGDLTLDGAAEPFANVLTEGVTVRLAVNFKEGKAYAYNEAGEVISESTLTVPTTNVSTLDEWRKVARNYLLYVYMFRPNSSAEKPASIGFDNVSVKEGNVFI